LFPLNQHSLIVKTGETIRFRSQEHKELYDTSLNNKAFKINARVIFKNDGKKVDVVCGEVARNVLNRKIMTDEGKLSHETKDAVDSTLSLVKKPAQTFSIQINACNCLIATQQMIRNGFNS
ncbi:uncharacterized protein B0P05DRAFT_480928, partial [Gilbertella persicaria]|uniref:uncharacterized protein n=1 Tax=Gilbertella persicaria TaxID=101096 RepID=UPI002220F1B8